MTIAAPVLVALKSNPEIMGVMIACPVITLNNELVVRAAVCWDAPEMRSPCPAFVDPNDLSYVDVLGVDEGFEDDDEEGEEGELEEASNEPEGV